MVCIVAVSERLENHARVFLGFARGGTRVPREAVLGYEASLDGRVVSRGWFCNAGAASRTSLMGV